MTEAEKDAFIVQLRGDVVKYRDAAIKEIKELKEKTK